MLSKKLRPWVCALPQRGWGGSTFEGYVESIGMRPETGEPADAEVMAVLASLVVTGVAHTFIPDATEEDPEPVQRWELTDGGHDALVALIDPEDGATVEEVLLELQPGIDVSKAVADAEVQS